jgi:hypothetical protein
MQKKVVAVLLFVFSLGIYAPVATAEAETLTINKVVELAVLHSPELKQMKNKVELAYRTEIVSKQAKEWAYYSWEHSRFQNPALEADYRAKKKMWENAQDDLSDVKTSLEQTEKRIEYDAENLYLTILNLKNKRGILEDAVKLQTRLVQVERVKLKIGLSTKLQVQQVQETAETTQNSLKELKDNLTTLYWQFNRMIGQEVDTPFQLASVAFSPVKYSGKEEGLEQAKEASLALEQFNRMLKDTRKDKRDLAPGNSDRSLLFEAQMRQLELNIDDYSFGLETVLKRAWEKIELAQKKLIEAKNKYEKAKLNQEYQEKQYAVGVLPGIALDSGVLELKQAMSTYEQMVYDYYLATRELALVQQGIVLGM